MPACIFQIPVQCKENPEGQDGMVVSDMEAFPMVNILCVEDLRKVREFSQNKKQ